MDTKKARCLISLSKVDKNMLDLLQSHREELDQQEKDKIMIKIMKLQKIQALLIKQLKEKRLN